MGGNGTKRDRAAMSPTGIAVIMIHKVTMHKSCYCSQIARSQKKKRDGVQGKITYYLIRQSGTRMTKNKTNEGDTHRTLKLRAKTRSVDREMLNHGIIA